MYSDSLLMVDENKLNPDIAKISAALSSATYTKGSIYNILDRMGFSTILQKNYEYEYTFSDCHHVAYNIGRKMVGDYTIYCVTVRGTRDAMEWVSDFMVGNDGTYYTPFYEASKEVENDLMELIECDNTDPDKRIILMTGHSRGGAVANIIASRMTARGDGHVFAYTFASPAVYFGNAVVYSNIYNYIFENDIVPQLLLTSWGYTRFGKDLRKDISSWNSLYASKAEMDMLIDMIGLLTPGSQKSKLVFSMLSWAMADGDFEFLREILRNQMDDPGEIANLVEDGIGLDDSTVEFRKECLSMLSFWENNKDTMKRLTEEEWENYRLQEAEIFDIYDSAAGTVVSSYDQLAAIIPTIQQRNTAANNLYEANNIFSYIFRDKWEPTDICTFSTHSNENYTKWANQLYFGYEGHKGRSLDDVLILVDTKTISPNCFDGVSGDFEVILDNVQAIGREAFANCSGLSSVELSERQEYVGYHAFCYSEKLKTVTLPCDFPYRDYFEECPVETLIYTPGKTGVVPDRTGYDMETDWMLEYDVRLTLKNLVFEEGITHIGSNLLYYDGKGGSGHGSSPVVCGGYLEYVSLPSTLKSIGDLSFLSCSILNRIEFPEGLESLGVSSFASSGLVEIDFPSTLTAIPDGAFANCSLLTEVVILDTIATVGVNAFTDCTNLWKLTLSANTGFNDSFTGCGAVETIVYTAGSAGKIADRTEKIGSHNHDYTSEYMPEMNVRGSLKEIIFEEGVTHIGDYLCCNKGYSSKGYFTYDSCEKLERIVLPSTLKSIGMYAFAYCDQLANIVFHSAADASISFYERAFYTSSWKPCYIGVQNIAEINPYLADYDWAGSGRDATFTVKLDGPFEIDAAGADIVLGAPFALSVTSLPNGYGLDDLVWSINDETVAQINAEGMLTFGRAGYITVSVGIPEMDLSDELVLGCEGTKIIRLPEMLSRISEEAFVGLSAEIVIIPESVERVETLAFSSCPNLYKVILQNPDTVIDDGAFENSGYVTVVVEGEEADPAA